MNARALQVLYAAYLVGACLVMGGLVVSMVSPAFRYWALRQGQQMQYRLALLEYERRHAPARRFLQGLDADELPQEPS